MKLNLLVIRVNSPKRCMLFYQLLLDKKFHYHRHGKGPFHYATEVEDVIFEIYPLLKTQTETDTSLRLGFQVPNLEELLLKLKEAQAIILQDTRKSEWGYRAVVQDPDGRKIELCETPNTI